MSPAAFTLAIRSARSSLLLRQAKGARIPHRARAFLCFGDAVTRWIFLLTLLAGCTRFGPLYPSRPAAHPSPLVADPSPSRVNVHVSLSGAALQSSLEDVVPRTGDGTLSLLGSERP